jgi:diacylglycerol kinase
MAEIVDGGAMVFSDVAMIRTAVVVVLMWVVAFFGRRCSKAALPLAIAAGIFFLAETLNTLVEMLVDRISLEANVFSARIKHASAFLSACVGTVAFLLLALVGYHMFFRAPSSPGCAHCQQAPTWGSQVVGAWRDAERGPRSGPEPRRGSEGGSMDPERERSSDAEGSEGVPSLSMRGSELQLAPGSLELAGSGQVRSDPVDPERERSSDAEGSEGVPAPPVSATELQVEAPSPESHPVQGAEGTPSLPLRGSGAAAKTPRSASLHAQRQQVVPHSYVRWLREAGELKQRRSSRGTRQAEAEEHGEPERPRRPFVSRHVLHPFDWERRVAHKRRLRRRRAVASSGSMQLTVGAEHEAVAGRNLGGDGALDLGDASVLAGQSGQAAPGGACRG